MLNPLIKGNARLFVLHTWPQSLTLHCNECNDNAAINAANQLFTYIVSNKITRSQAFDSWRYNQYTPYLTDNQLYFIQELIWSNCYPIA